MAIKALCKKIFAFIIILGLIWFLFHIPPFIFSIKEPTFNMPIETDGLPKTTKSLPVRKDVFGEGRFGAKRKNNRKHEGIDLIASFKSPVFASKSGWARHYYFPRGYGHCIIINHPGKWQTRYGHLYKSNIKNSRWVWQGEVIGFVGKSGNANARGIKPHLHFEIRCNGEPIDPAQFLIREEG